MKMNKMYFLRARKTSKLCVCVIILSFNAVSNFNLKSEKSHFTYRVSFVYRLNKLHAYKVKMFYAKLLTDSINNRNNNFSSDK